MSIAQVLVPRTSPHQNMGSGCYKPRLDTAEATEFSDGASLRESVAASRQKQLEAHHICGTTVDGVHAYSNGHSNRWDGGKNYVDGLFMGYKWQCVEFARRWLWSTRRLLLQQRNCAYCFAGLQYVYRPRLNEGVNPQAELQQSDWAPKTTWEKVPVRYVKQGSLAPPQPRSLIIYPMSCGSPWGHIGVITDVDVERRLVHVADQNRYFHEWNGSPHSDTFALDVVNGRYYIRDFESECKGWIEFYD